MTEWKRKENRYHMISHEGKDGLTYLTFPVLDGAENVRHLFSTRKGGVSRGIYESMNLSFHRVLFSFIGNQMNKKLMEKAGGGPGSMMFGGAGKSNAKVYVQSTHGIRFADVAGEDEAKENLQEIVNLAIGSVHPQSPAAFRQWRRAGRESRRK